MWLTIIVLILWNVINRNLMHVVSSVIVEVEVRGPGGGVRLRALVDTGFYGDVVTTPHKVQGLGIGFMYERARRLPSLGGLAPCLAV